MGVTIRSPFAKLAKALAVCQFGLAALAAGEAGAQGRAVELELVLAIDTSASVDLYEYGLQIAGLAAAFRDPTVQGAIGAVGDDGSAVSLVQWAVGLQQTLAVDWSWVGDRVSAERFARIIEATPRRYVGNGTAIGEAIRFSIEQINSNRFAGRHKAIDIAADGRNNEGGQPAVVGARASAQGITVNALAIEDGDRHLGAYMSSNLIAGTGAFVITANDYEDFARAIRRKLLREIPAPLSSLQAIGAGTGMSKRDTATR